MANRIVAAQVSDTTDDDSSTAAGFHPKYLFKAQLANNLTLSIFAHCLKRCKFFYGISCIATIMVSCNPKGLGFHLFPVEMNERLTLEQQ